MRMSSYRIGDIIVTDSYNRWGYGKCKGIVLKYNFNKEPILNPYYKVEMIKKGKRKSLWRKDHDITLVARKIT